MSPPATGGSGTGPDWAGLAIAAGLIAIAAVVAWDAYNIRIGVATYSRIGPRAFPYAIAACLAAAGLATAIAARRRGEPRPPQNLKPMAWIVAGLLAQLAMLPYGGFSLATGAVFAATARGFGRGPVWLTYPIGVAISLAIWLIFARGLKLILPIGPLEQMF